LDKLVEIFELSERFKGLLETGAGITWARELLGVNKKLLTPSVIDAMVGKVSRKRIRIPRICASLRAILPDPVARQHFLNEEGDLDSALLRLGPNANKEKGGLASDLETAVESMKTCRGPRLPNLRRMKIC